MTKEEDDFKVKLISLSEAYTAGIKVAKKINSSSLSFDAIVGIARGGMPPARFLCDLLNIDTLYSIQVRHYSEGAKQKNTTEISNKNTDNLEGKKILLVDDINDSGDSLKAAHEELSQPVAIKTAVLHEKENTQFAADYVGETIEEWRWCIYQWAAAEDIIAFLNKGDMLKASHGRMKEFLKKQYDLDIGSDLLENLLNFEQNYT
ncbi:MAG: phosphoribosyltransferase [Fulvivirga sp.]|nr:phosphoribosyltransferase [Fulvivirga sp.]